MHGRLAAILLVGAALLWDGCGETSPKNPSSDASPNHATDGQPSLPDGISNPSEDAAPFLGCFDHLPVDLLFIVDNSHSMAEEQDNLIRNFPVLIRVLTQPPDRNRDGRPDFQPVEDIRIGITSTDLGTAPYRVEGCNTTGGDRGILITQPRTSDPSCADVRLSPSEPWLSYRLGDDINQLAHRFSCLCLLYTS
ncbi:MAG: hypothetical protein N2515_04615, partial [Deltaproteobacteria bacterium]|nr:hypothetical protein [Deltaproteobacteria bacterium]